MIENQQIEGGVMRRMHNARSFILLTIIMLVTGCASTYKDLIPQQPVGSPRSTPLFNGSVEIHSIIKPERMGFDIAYDLPIGAYVNSIMLETALIESIANSAIFTRVEQKRADYVLDVWIDDVESHQPGTGIGAYSAKVFSIWRLTRVLDGKVLVCDFVDGSGLINTMVSAPRTKSLVAALKDVIQNGLRVIADTSNEHFSANPVARIRPSMGSAVPEDLREWENKVQKNWPNLRQGLSMKQVENIIGPVRTCGSLERIYQKFKTWKGSPLENAIFLYTIKDNKDIEIKYFEEILLDKHSLTYYDKGMGNTVLMSSARCKTFPYYDMHSYILNEYLPQCMPHFFITFSHMINDRSVYIMNTNIPIYYMTHLYVLKFNFAEELQTWVLR